MSWVYIDNAFYAWTSWHMYEIYKSRDNADKFVAWCYVTDEEGTTRYDVERHIADNLEEAKLWCDMYDKYRQAHVLEKQQSKYRIHN